MTLQRLSSIGADAGRGLVQYLLNLADLTIQIVESTILEARRYVLGKLFSQTNIYSHTRLDMLTDGGRVYQVVLAAGQ